MRRFLRPSFSDFHPPGRLTGLREAADRVEQAVQRGETILVHGDYDVDGMTGASVLALTLKDLGANVVPFVPHRGRDGYDLGEAGVARAREVGAGLIITADCGITAVPGVQLAGDRGIDVVVTDHHRPGPQLPDAVAIVNPNLAGESYPFQGLAGVGVAFKLVQELFDRKGISEGKLNQYLDLVGLGTIADQAPLEDENRTLARFGLHVLNRSRRPGLRALFGTANVGRWSEITAEDVAFRIAPRLNSAGRMADASDGLRLLLTEEDAEAETLAQRIDGFNVTRREIDRSILEEARARLSAEFDPDQDAAIVLWADGWHPGVLGIVASRLTEEFHRPVVLVGLDGERGRGSARSVAGFHLFNALETCRDLFERFGGHAVAAGFDIRRDRLESLRTRFGQVASVELGPNPPTPPLVVDGELAVRSITPAVSRGLRYLAPFGNGNRTPRFMAEGVRLRNIEPVGQDGSHARFILEDGSASVEAIAFAQPDLASRVGQAPQDIVYELKVETGRRGIRTQAHVVVIGRPTD